MLLKMCANDLMGTGCSDWRRTWPDNDSKGRRHRMACLALYKASCYDAHRLDSALLIRVAINIVVIAILARRY